MKFIQTLEYKFIFSDSPPKIDDLLQGISTKNLIKLFSSLSSQIHGKENDFTIQIDLINDFTSRFEPQFRKNLLNKISTLESYNFINHRSNLKVIQYALANFNESDVDSNEFTVQEKVKIFKAYLIFNEQWTSKFNHLDNSHEIYLNVLSIYLLNKEFTTSKNVLVQLIKSSYIFTFLSESEIFSDLYRAFLVEYEISHWKEYILNIFSSLKLGVNGMPPYQIKINNEHKIYKKWIEKLCIIPSQNQNDVENFKDIREKPFFQVSETEFIYLNYNFLLDKIYKGVSWELLKIGRKHNLNLQGKPFTFENFKSVYSSQFSEKEMFFNLMEFILSKKSCKHYSDIELAQMNINAPPDYMILDGNKLMILEFKDSFFAEKSFSSCNAQDIKNEISRKMIVNDKGNPKGVTQLSNIIHLIANNSSNTFNFIPQKTNKLKIFPVIVFTDSAFDAFVVNYFLKTKLSDLIKSLNFPKIVDLTLINIDDLILLQDRFKDKDANLFTIIEKYQNFINNDNKNYPQNKYYSFNYYLENYQKNLLDKIPNVLWEVVEKMYDD